MFFAPHNARHANTATTYNSRITKHQWRQTNHITHELKERILEQRAELYQGGIGRECHEFVVLQHERLSMQRRAKQIERDECAADAARRQAAHSRICNSKRFQRHII